MNSVIPEYDPVPLGPADFPLVSVCIPTYRRPDLVVRAVGSALLQTYENLEVVVSDDAEDNLAAAALDRAFGGDPRLRVVMNRGEKGQVGNTNNSFLHARGEWIKPLHDDDVLKPQCIERLLAVARGRDVALVTCRADRFYDGRLVKQYVRGSDPWLESISPARSAAAAYLLCDLGGSLPSQQFVHRSVLDAGILFQLVGNMHTAVDTCWRIRVLSYGPGLILNENLVEWHQGQHETVTSAVALDLLDEEFVELRGFIRAHIRSDIVLPAIPVVEGFVRLVRAAARAKRGHFAAAAHHVRRVRHPKSYVMMVRHLLGRQAIPDFQPKTVLQQSPDTVR